MRSGFALLASLCLAASASADVQFNLTMGDLRTENGSSLLGTDRLIQFVSLGPNGVFDPVPVGAWVGGDDVLVNFSFGSAEFPSAAGFDLQEFDPMFPMDNGTPGQLIRVMTINGTALPQTTRVGIRWFPAFSVSDFYSGAITRPLEPYGEYSDVSWAFPADGQIVDLSMLTTSQGGSVPNSAGFANFTAVPEISPQWTGLLAAAVVGFTWRARQARRRSVAA